jgi:hypothetical protein
MSPSTSPGIVAQVQCLPPEFDVRGVRPRQLDFYADLAAQARDAFRRGVQEQPDEWVLHLYLGKSCASSASTTTVHGP